MASEETKRPGRDVSVSLRVNLVFITKARSGALTDELLMTCEDSMRNVCTDFGATLLEFCGATDHVHLQVEYPPMVTVPRIVNSLKGVSSRRLRERHRQHIERHSFEGSFWSPSYLAASYGDPEDVRKYIERHQLTASPQNGMDPKGRERATLNELKGNANAEETREEW